MVRSSSASWVDPTGAHAVRWDAQNGWVDLGSLQKKVQQSERRVGLTDT